MHHRCKQGTQKNRKLQSIQGLPNGFVQILLPTKDILSRKSQTSAPLERPPGNPFFQTKRLFVEKHLLALQSNELLTPGNPGVYDSRVIHSKSTKGACKWRQEAKVTNKTLCHKLLGHTFQFLQPTNVKMTFLWKNIFPVESLGTTLGPLAPRWSSLLQNYPPQPWANGPMVGGVEPFMLDTWVQLTQGFAYSRKNRSNHIHHSSLPPKTNK